MRSNQQWQHIVWWSEPKHIVLLDQMEFSRFGVPAVKHGGEGGFM